MKPYPDVINYVVFEGLSVLDTTTSANRSADRDWWTLGCLIGQQEALAPPCFSLYISTTVTTKIYFGSLRGEVRPLV